jgi:Flp pilus assembly protein TadG
MKRARHRTRPPVSSERGSITVVTAAVIGLALICSMGAADIAKALVARAHAEAAADAVALAVAQELAFPSGRDTEGIAVEYAQRNDATLLSCECPADGTEAIVEVELPVGSLLLLPDDRTVTAWARAVVDMPGATGPTGSG